MSEVRIFGVRHHGPGCARSLDDALKAFAPDCVLIEGPPEADEILALAKDPNMQPPVALFIYETQNPKNASFYPFAVFSPEWVALQYAVQHDQHVAFMDLPQAFQKTWEKAPSSPVDADVSIELLHHDPLGTLAKAAGFEDGEKWWDELVESRATRGGDVFEAIGEAMAVLRAHEPEKQDGLEIAREAYMRLTIDKAQKRFQKIAVVCGAWHTPALLDRSKEQISKDTAIIKSLNGVKVSAAWAPWSYPKLASSSGYAAGIVSPQWYEAIWTYQEKVAPYWLSKAASLLREEGLEASSASVIEAVRLGDMLAGLRGRSTPVLEELEEAALTVLTHGQDAPLALIRKKLSIGEKLGQVPAEVPTTPVQADFTVQCKALKLNVEMTSIELDLRKDLDLNRSHFFHQLRLIGVPWGVLQRSKSKGTFKEIWFLYWQPEFVIGLVQASLMGPTIAQSASEMVRQKVQDAQSVKDLTFLLEDVLQAHLDLGRWLLEQIQDASAAMHDVFDLMQALVPLANLARYGSVRSRDEGSDTFSDKAMAQHLSVSLAYRICAGFRPAVQSLDDDMAQQVRGYMLQTHQAIDQLQDQDLMETWLQCLQHISNDFSIHGRLTGSATRLLFDRGIETQESVEQKLYQALSQAIIGPMSAAWIEGFLEGGASVFIHGQTILPMLDRWLTHLDPLHFMDVLPVLRRTFSNFEAAERRMIGEKLQKGTSLKASSLTRRGLDEMRALRVVPMIQLLLGQTR